MKASTAAVINEATAASSAGRLHFGQVVGMLAQAGVESYAVDYRSRRSTYYLPDGACCDVELKVPTAAIARDFDPAALIAAIRGAQQGRLLYPEFVPLSMAAGCVAYTVWIAGRHVCYFGRNGETHVERFPD